MNIKRAKQEIKDTVEAYLLKDEYGAYQIPVVRQRPVLLIGPPGVGKTQIVEAAAKECRIGFVSYTITHHTRQSAIGLPVIEDRIYGSRRMSVTEYTMSEIIASIYDKVEETGLREGILFIDEINCVSETLAPAMLQFLQCKTFGTHQIPDGWIIVAAGNPPEYNKSVREFDIVTLDRIKMINVEPDFSVWREYAEEVRIHPAIISYLEAKQQNFCRIETNVDGKRFATPRGWEDLSRLIEVYERLGKNVDSQVIFQYIQHSAIAKDFANYYELYKKYDKDYRIDEILGGLADPVLCDRLSHAPFDEKVSVISLLQARLNDFFRELSDKEERLSRLKELFGQMRPNAGQDDDYDTALERLEGLLGGVQAEWKYRKSAGLLNDEEDRLDQDLIDIMEKLVMTVKSEHLQSEDEIWAEVQTVFDRENDEYEALFDKCADSLEHAFDFMEASFGQSQEMVIFVTGLNTGVYSVKFLQQYECERYFMYNESLLFNSREKDILSKLDEHGL